MGPIAEALLAAVTIGGPAVTGVVVVRRRLPGLSGAPRVVAGGTAVTAALVAVHLLPALLGVLSRGSVALVAAAAAAASVLLVRPSTRAAGPPEPPGPHARERPLDVVLAAVAAGVAGTAVLARAAQSATDPVASTDVLAFDLPIVATWMQTGGVGDVTELFRDLSTHGTYPHNGHVALLAAVLPFRGDALVRFTSLPFLALAAAGVYALARELGARRSSGVVLASAFASIPAVWRPALDSMTDTFMLAMFAAGLLFALRRARGAGDSELVLAAVALGLAFGAKWYAVAYVPLAAVLASVLWMRAGRGARRALRDVTVVAGALALLGGIWLIRNLIATGDPVFPVRVAPLGVELFDAPRDVVRERVGFTLAHYAGDLDVLRRYVWPAFRSSFSAPGALCAIAILAAPLVAWRRAAGPARVVVAGLALLGAAIGLIYLVTPYGAFGPEGRPFLASANTRYLVPALAVGAALAAWAIDRLGPWRRPLLGLAAATAVAGSLTGGARAVALALGAALVAGALAAERRGAELPGVVPRPAWLGRAAAALALVLALTGCAVLAERDSGRPAQGHRPLAVHVADRAAGGRRIALSRFWDYPDTLLAWDLHGPDVRNRVLHLGGVHKGSVDPPGTRAGFVAALERQRPDLLVVSRHGDPAPRELAWARAAGYRDVLADGRLLLLERRGP